MFSSPVRDIDAQNFSYFSVMPLALADAKNAAVSSLQPFMLFQYA